MGSDKDNAANSLTSLDDSLMNRVMTRMMPILINT